MMDQVIDSDMVYLIQSCLDCRRVAYYVKHTDTKLDIDIDIHNDQILLRWSFVLDKSGLYVIINL